MNILSAWLKSLRDQRQKRLDEERKSAVMALERVSGEVRHFVDDVYRERPLTVAEAQELAVDRRALFELNAYICARVPKSNHHANWLVSLFGSFLNHSEVA